MFSNFMSLEAYEEKKIDHVRYGKHETVPGIQGAGTLEVGGEWVCWGCLRCGSDSGSGPRLRSNHFQILKEKNKCFCYFLKSDPKTKN